MGLEIPDEGPKQAEVRERSPEPVEEVEVTSFSLFDYVEEDVKKVAILGEANTGKTHAGAIELIDMLLNEGVDPNDIHIEYIDLDGGISQLLKQRTFPKEYFKCINYSPCDRFGVVEKATENAFENLEKFTEEHPLRGAWIVVDNTKRAWRWVQDDYCRSVYGMSLTEKMEQARRSQLAAKKRGPGAKGEGVFNRNLDYSVITPIHNDWFTKFATCSFNVLLLSPWTTEELKDKNNPSKIIGYRDRWGQGDNDLVPDYVVKKYFDPNRKRLADFTKSRSTEGLPTQIRNPSLYNLFEAIRKLEAIEAKERTKEMKKRDFPPLLDSSTEKENRVVKERVEEVEDSSQEMIEDENEQEEVEW